MTHGPMVPLAAFEELKQQVGELELELRAERDSVAFQINRAVGLVRMDLEKVCTELVKGLLEGLGDELVFLRQHGTELADDVEDLEQSMGEAERETFRALVALGLEEYAEGFQPEPLGAPRPADGMAATIEEARRKPREDPKALAARRAHTALPIEERLHDVPDPDIGGGP